MQKINLLETKLVDGYHLLLILDHLYVAINNYEEKIKACNKLKNEYNNMGIIKAAQNNINQCNNQIEIINNDIHNYNIKITQKYEEKKEINSQLSSYELAINQYNEKLQEYADQINLYQLEIEENNRLKQQYNDYIDNDIQIRINQLNERINTCNNYIRENKEIYDNYNNQMNEYNEIINQYYKEITENNKKIDDCNFEIRRIRIRNGIYNNSINESILTIDDYQQIDKINKQIKQYEELIDEIKKKIQQYNELIYATNNQLIKYDNIIKNYELQILSYKEEIDRNNKEINIYIEKIDELDKKNKDININIDRYKEYIESYEYKIEVLMEQINEYKKQIHDINIQIEEYDEIIHKYNGIINEYEQKINEYKDIIKNNYDEVIIAYDEEIQKYENIINKYKERVNLLKNIPTNNEYVYQRVYEYLFNLNIDLDISFIDNFIIDRVNREVDKINEYINKSNNNINNIKEALTLMNNCIETYDYTSKADEIVIYNIYNDMNSYIKEYYNILSKYKYIIQEYEYYYNYYNNNETLKNTYTEVINKYRSVINDNKEKYKNLLVLLMNIFDMNKNIFIKQATEIERLKELIDDNEKYLEELIPYRIDQNSPTIFYSRFCSICGSRKLDIYDSKIGIYTNLNNFQYICNEQNNIIDSNSNLMQDKTVVNLFCQLNNDIISITWQDSNYATYKYSKLFINNNLIRTYTHNEHMTIPVEIDIKDLTNAIEIKDKMYIYGIYVINYDFNDEALALSSIKYIINNKINNESKVINDFSIKQETILVPQLLKEKNDIYYRPLEYNYKIPVNTENKFEISKNISRQDLDKIYMNNIYCKNLNEIISNELTKNIESIIIENKMKEDIEIDKYKTDINRNLNNKKMNKYNSIYEVSYINENTYKWIRKNVLAINYTPVSNKTIIKRSLNYPPRNINFDFSSDIINIKGNKYIFINDKNTLIQKIKEEINLLDLKIKKIINVINDLIEYINEQFLETMLKEEFANRIDLYKTYFYELIEYVNKQIYTLNENFSFIQNMKLIEEIKELINYLANSYEYIQKIDNIEKLVEKIEIVIKNIRDANIYVNDKYYVIDEMINLYKYEFNNSNNTDTDNTNIDKKTEIINKKIGLVEYITLIIGSIEQYINIVREAYEKENNFLFDQKNNNEELKYWHFKIFPIEDEIYAKDLTYNALNFDENDYFNDSNLYKIWQYTGMNSNSVGIQLQALTSECIKLRCVNLSQRVDLTWVDPYENWSKTEVYIKEYDGK